MLPLYLFPCNNMCSDSRDYTIDHVRGWKTEPILIDACLHPMAMIWDTWECGKATPATRSMVKNYTFNLLFLYGDTAVV